MKRIPRCIPITDANYERILALGAGTASDGIEIILQEVSAHADDPTRIVLPGE